MAAPAPRCALVLAGGRSVRMGRPKATLAWQGRTMVEHVSSVLETCCAQVLVVGHTGLVLPTLGSRTTRVDDTAELDDQGPLAGVHRGLTHLAASCPPRSLVYIAAVDKPLLTRVHVDFMFSALEESSCDAVLPVRLDAARRTVHPLAGVLRLQPALDAAQALLRDGERALKRLFATLPHREIPADALPSADVLRDCNTPADYAATRTFAAADRP